MAEIITTDLTEVIITDLTTVPEVIIVNTPTIIEGPTGLQGATGATGATGPQGDQGIQGIQGNVGPVGPQGIQGNVGPQGPAGDVGADGTSVSLKGSVATVGDLPSGGNTAGDLYIVLASGDGYVWSGSTWDNIGPIRGPQGDTGAQGIQGNAATISVGNVTTGAAGSNVTITNTGTTSAAVFDFEIPQGVQGIQGETGLQGIQGNIGPQGPAGNDGATGPQGLQGIQGNIGLTGSAATISVGNVSTGAAGSNVSITNTGTSSAAVFDFAIPQGATGETGAQGPQGIQGPAGNDGATGATGAQGIQGNAATISVGNVTTGNAGSNVTITNTGTTSSAVFDFAIPRGDVGATGPQGDQGIQGIQGETGPQGIQGNVGPVGPQGIQGNVGPQGTQGIQGIQGETGATGATGPQGPAGATANIAVKDEGTTLTSTLESINFVGAGVVANTTNGNVTVTIAGDPTDITGNANNASYLGGVVAADYVTSTKLNNQTLAANVTSLTSSGNITVQSGGYFKGDGSQLTGVQTALPGAGIPNSTGSAWGTSYTTTGTGDVVLNWNPTIKGTITGNIAGAVSTLTVSGNAVAVDLGENTNFALTLQATTSQVLSNPTNITVGQSGQIAITQNATPSLLTFGSYWVPIMTDPQVDSTANSVTLLTYYVVSSTKIWFGLSMANGSMTNANNASYLGGVISSNYALKDSFANIVVKDEGTTITSQLKGLDFVGAGVTATQSSGNVTVTITPTSIAAWDEGVSLTSTVTGLNFTGNGVVATNSGGNLTLTITDTIGATGPGVAAGGTTGQALVKNSNTDYDTAWQTISGTGTVTSVNITTGSTGLTATGGPITTAGNIELGGNLKANYRTVVSNVSYSATPTIDWTGVDVARILLTGNCTPTFTGAVDGQKCILEVWQDGTGSRAMTYTSANVRYGTDITTITHTTTASKKDRVGFIYDSAAGKYDVVAVVKGF